jgi:hypothetical protein
VGIIWTIIIGFVAGVIAKLVTPGSNEPSGFILTTINLQPSAKKKPITPSDEPFAT